jgi:hypothetical protein
MLILKKDREIFFLKFWIFCENFFLHFWRTREIFFEVLNFLQDFFLHFEGIVKYFSRLWIFCKIFFLHYNTIQVGIRVSMVIVRVSGTNIITEVFSRTRHPQQQLSMALLVFLRGLFSFFVWLAWLRKNPKKNSVRVRNELSTVARKFNSCVNILITKEDVFALRYLASVS